MEDTDTQLEQYVQESRTELLSRTPAQVQYDGDKGTVVVTLPDPTGDQWEDLAYAWQAIRDQVVAHNLYKPSVQAYLASLLRTEGLS